MNNIFIIIIIFLCVVLGWLTGVFWGYKTTWQYEVNGRMDTGRNMYEILIKPRRMPPFGLPTITSTIMKIDIQKDLWHFKIGNEDKYFKEINPVTLSEHNDDILCGIIIQKKGNDYAEKLFFPIPKKLEFSAMTEAIKILTNYEGDKHE